MVAAGVVARNLYFGFYLGTAVQPGIPCCLVFGDFADLDAPLGSSAQPDLGLLPTLPCRANGNLRCAGAILADTGAGEERVDW